MKIIIPLFCIVLLQIACGNAKSKQNKNTIKSNAMKDSSFVNSTINFTVQENQELLAVVRLLAEDKFSISKVNSAYKKDALNYFSKYKNHEAVSQFNAIKKAAFITYDAPVVFFNQFDVPSFKIVKPLNEAEINKYGFDAVTAFNEEGNGFGFNKTRLQKFVIALKQFYTDTKFETFYQRHQSFYKSLIDTMQAIPNKDEYVKNTITYFGEKPTQYTLIVCPLYADMQHTIYENNNDFVDLVGPDDRYETTTFFRENMLYNALHHVSFTMTERVIEKYFEGKTMTTDNDQFRTCLYNDLYNANMFYIEQDLGALNLAIATEALNVSSSNLYLVMKFNYQKNRNKYPTQYDFINEIVAEVKRNNNGTKNKVEVNPEVTKSAQNTMQASNVQEAIKDVPKFSDKILEKMLNEYAQLLIQSFNHPNEKNFTEKAVEFSKKLVSPMENMSQEDMQLYSQYQLHIGDEFRKSLDK